MLDRLFGAVTVSCSGDGIPAFMNAVKQDGILLKSMRIVGGSLIAQVGRHDYEAFSTLAEKHAIALSEIKRSGMFFFTFRYRHRIGWYAGFAAAVMIILFMYNTVLKIEIYGCENMSEESIMSALEDCGITYGSFIPKLDMKSAAEEIRGRLKDVAWITIRHNGSRICVELEEMTQAPNVLKKNRPCNIVATHDAQITAVKVSSGRLIPMLGEGVREGSVLVSGVIEDRFGKNYFVHSIAEITGIYNEKAVFTQYCSEEERVCVGEPSEYNELFAFGLHLPLYFRGNMAPDYEYEEKRSYLTFLNMTFPIGYVQKKYTVYEIRTVNYTEEQARAVLDEKIALYEKNFLSEVKIIERELQECFDGQKAEITIKYTLEGEIGEKKEIFAK